MIETSAFFERQTMAQPLVGIIMGSKTDWVVMQNAAKQLETFDVAFEARVLSTHRTPDQTLKYAETARERGLACLIAGAGGAAHLPGVLAAKTILPILGVPIPSSHLKGLDALLAIVQMPRGIPVATFAIGEAGAANAALFAVALLAVQDARPAARLTAHRPAPDHALLG